MHISKVDEATEIAISAKAIAEANTIAIAELKNEIKDELKAEFEAEIIELRTELKDVKQKYQYLDRENEDRKRHTNNIEMYSRRDNIVFYGIHEEAQECTSACARKFMVDILKIPHPYKKIPQIYHKYTTNIPQKYYKMYYCTTKM